MCYALFVGHQVALSLDLTILKLSYSKKEKSVLNTVTHRIRTYNTQITKSMGRVVTPADDLMTHLS